MCNNMTEFEELVQTIQNKKAEIKKLDTQLEDMKEALKNYLKKRKKEELLSQTTGLNIAFKKVESPKFSKDLFIKAYSQEEYKKYLTVVSSMRLYYLKPKK